MSVASTLRARMEVENLRFDRERIMLLASHFAKLKAAKSRNEIVTNYLVLLIASFRWLTFASTPSNDDFANRIRVE
jgi:hypothetical protein